MKRDTLSDYLIIGEIVVIGLAEAAHLISLLLGLSFTSCTMLFGGLAAAALIGGTGLWFRKKRLGKAGARQVTWRPDRTEALLYAIFLAIVISQLIFACIGDNNYRQGDMTVETVGSFLASDGIYQVNPLTGMPYREGMPFRLKILCLPTLYGSLCRLTGAEPGTLVRTVVPAVVLLSSYGAFLSLGKTLFPDDRRRQACFLLIVSILLWAGAYSYGMDGFDILCCGWRGVTVRNSVLLPWLVSLCLRRKRVRIILCVMAEACMVWTLYGCGVCLAVAAGMAAAQLFSWRLEGDGLEKPAVYRGREGTE